MTHDTPPRLMFSDLLQRAPNLKNEPGWEDFRPGVSVKWLYRDKSTGASAALLRYDPGAKIPRHEHVGYEHILVLDGEQCDDNGCYGAGTFVINRPDDEHSVSSPKGCVVLITWERGVRFV